MKITKRDLREIIAEQLKESAQQIDDISREGEDMGYDPIADMLGIPQGDAEDFAAAARVRKGSTVLPSGQKAMSPEDIEDRMRSQAEDLGIDPEVYMARMRKKTPAESPPIKESNMKLTKQRLKALILEEMSSTGVMPDERPELVAKMVDDRRGGPTTDQLKAEVILARRRFLDTFEADPKKAGFRLAADLTAIERMFEKINDASGGGMLLSSIPGLELLRKLYTNMVGGETLSVGSFGADPMDPAFNKQISMTMADEEGKTVFPAAVPVGRMKNVNESRRITKQKLYRIIKEEMQAVMEQFPQDAQDMFDKMDDEDFESGESEEGGVKTTRTKANLGNWKLKALAVAANGMSGGWDKHRGAFEKAIAPANPEDKAMLLQLYQNKDITGIQNWALGKNESVSSEEKILPPIAKKKKPPIAKKKKPPIAKKKKPPLAKKSNKARLQKMIDDTKAKLAKTNNASKKADLQKRIKAAEANLKNL